MFLDQNSTISPESVPFYADALEATYYAVAPEVVCQCWDKPEDRANNIEYALTLDIPHLRVIPIAQSKPIAIVGGGPSLKYTWDKISSFDTIITCGTTHEHIKTIGIKPTYHLECDSDFKGKETLYDKPMDTTYLIASRCPKLIFDALKGQNVMLWHLFEESLDLKIYRNEVAIRTGSTCTLAALAIAVAMGYADLHFFGFDSSYETPDIHHAYPVEQNADIIVTRIGSPTGRQFITTNALLAQAQQFREIQHFWGHVFKATIYGDGMIAELQRVLGKA